MKLVTMVLVFASVLLSGCAWWQKNEPAFSCAALATVADAPQLVDIVEGCTLIAVNASAIPACVAAAAASKWPTDIINCFELAAQGKLTCPAYSVAKMAK